MISDKYSSGISGWSGLDDSTPNQDRLLMDDVKDNKSSGPPSAAKIQASATQKQIDKNIYEIGQASIYSELALQQAKTDALPDEEVKKVRALVDPTAPDPDIPRSFAAKLEALQKSANEMAYLGHGFGSYYQQYSTVLKGIDRLGNMIIPPNKVYAGYTFITRPKLNLSSSNIRYDRIMSMLDTGADYNNLSFMIRCLLDTNYAGREDIKDYTRPDVNPFLDGRNPFITPLTNCLRSISGFPDFNIESETTDGGFFGENVTFALGGDELAGTFDLNTTFRDIQGGVIFAILWYWLRFIKLVTRGQLIAYNEDIEARRLCYTSSIYRLVVDPTARKIVYWAKATGCMPKNISVGTLFNMNEGERTLQSVNNHTVNWVANDIKYMDPAILMDFNKLVRRFAPNIDRYEKIKNKKGKMISVGPTPIPLRPELNYTGLPYIDLESGALELQFREPLFKSTAKSAHAVVHEALKLKAKGSRTFNGNKPIYKKALNATTAVGLNVYGVGSVTWNGIKRVLGWVF